MSICIVHDSFVRLSNLLLCLALSRSFLVTVGSRTVSHAQYHMGSARDVLGLLEMLSGNSAMSGSFDASPIHDTWRPRESTSAASFSG